MRPIPNPNAKKAVIVGAGPVGLLTALALAKHGWSVEIYESRPDMRLPSSKAASSQRSINLAISHRGIAALEAIKPAAAQRFLQSAIPMRGRMIHKSSGELDSQLYDRDGQCINSIDRALLNEALLDEASEAANIRLYFQHKVTAIDFDAKFMTVRDSASSSSSSSSSTSPSSSSTSPSSSSSHEFTVPFDLCVGADGSYSVVRRQMMRVVRMNYQQEYIRDEYLELRMPAGRDRHGEPTFQLDPNHLHIWPRHSFMLIALPNKDKTFTCTLFAPSAELDRLCSTDCIFAWFQSQFPDAARAIGEQSLAEDFKRNPRSPLICTKTNPYHYKDRAIILGDAAHSMVPFYGQGLNAGLEDVRILTTLFAEEGVTSAPSPSPNSIADDKNGQDRRLAAALQRYTDTRHEDLIAISDLAMNNYVEMRHSVTQLSYLFRKTLDNLLYSLTSPKAITLSSLIPTLARLPYPTADNLSGWLPLYTMVTFRPDISYATVRKRAARQASILNGLSRIGVAVLAAAGAWLTWSTTEMVLNVFGQKSSK